MEKEQIIKALECFHNRILKSKLAEKVTEQEMMAIIDALALIKELTEECEKLKSIGISKDIVIESLAEENAKLTKKIEMSEAAYQGLQVALSICANQVKSDTVREFSERLKYTLCINNEENTEFFDYSYTLETIDEVANKILNKNTEDEEK